MQLPIHPSPRLGRQISQTFDSPHTMAKLPLHHPRFGRRVSQTLDTPPGMPKLEEHDDSSMAIPGLDLWDSYTLRHGLVHLVQAAHEGVIDTVCDIRYVETKAEAGLALDLAKEFFQGRQGLEEMNLRSAPRRPEEKQRAGLCFAT